MGGEIVEVEVVVVVVVNLVIPLVNQEKPVKMVNVTMWYSPYTDEWYSCPPGDKYECI
jgi:hypothetical protein